VDCFKSDFNCYWRTKDPFLVVRQWMQSISFVLKSPIKENFQKQLLSLVSNSYMTSIFKIHDFTHTYMSLLGFRGVIYRHDICGLLFWLIAWAFLTQLLAAQKVDFRFFYALSIFYELIFDRFHSFPFTNLWPLLFSLFLHRLHC